MTLFAGDDMDKRTDSVTVKFTTDERRQLEKIAIYEGSDLSKVIRQAILARLDAHRANLVALKEMLFDDVAADNG